MTQTVPDLLSDLDAVFAPYEARPIAVTPDEMTERRHDLDLGDQLNRLQGAELHPVADRLGQLWITGRISKDEYVDLVGRLARGGHFNGRDEPSRN